MQFRSNVPYYDVPYYDSTRRGRKLMSDPMPPTLPRPPYEHTDWRKARGNIDVQSKSRPLTVFSIPRDESRSMSVYPGPPSRHFVLDLGQSLCLSFRTLFPIRRSLSGSAKSSKNCALKASSFRGLVIVKREGAKSSPCERPLDALSC